MRQFLLPIVPLIALFALTNLAAAQNFPAPADIPAAKINHEALDKMGWKLSVQCWTFNRLSIYETLDILHALGVHYVEFYPGQKLRKDGGKLDHNAMSDEDITALLAKCKELGITPVNYGVVGLPGDEKGARKVFEFAKKLGLLTIVSEPDKAAFPTLSKLADEYKINVAVHDHPKQDNNPGYWYWNPDELKKVVDGLSPRVGSCSDTGHWYRSGLMPADCLKKLEGHVISLHLKDLTKNKQDTPWGTGECDTKAMLDELVRQKLKPVISIEYESTTGKVLVDNVRKCCEYLSAEAERRVAEMPK